MKLLTLARDIQRRKAREKLGLFAAEGVRTVEELTRSRVPIRGVLVSPQLADAPRGLALLGMLRTAGVETVEVTAAEFASAAETESPQGVLALGQIPEARLEALALPPVARIVVLDAVQDPGNAGTILRTAAALGAAGVAAMPGTVDLWNAKVVRSAMGASFHLPVLSATWTELDDYRTTHNLTLWGADVGGPALESLVPPARLGLIVGNEGGGLSGDARARVDSLASLPIGSIVESLNVAVATGIFLYQLRT
ncbi:MAG: RNA methyltransferase [Gemmatimonadota bacterium]